MKKIITFLLFTCFVNAQDYNNLFTSLDSVQQKEVYPHLRQIKKLINYEIVKQETEVVDNVFIKGVFFLNSQGKFNLVIIDEKSKKYEEIILDVLSKLPAAHCSKYFNEYTSFRIKLYNINNQNKFYKELIEEKENVPPAFKELSTYPAFKKHKFLYNKEKSIDLFSNAMAKHIKEKLKYPEKAMNQNIQGRTNVYFIITSEGTISDIFAVNAHPLLQLEGIRTIELLPKFIPGTIDGEAIGVSYAQPMTFKIQ